ncbi:MAG: hypothetical protein ABSH51_30560 [Solirubrobacteraceae bacterium]
MAAAELFGVMRDRLEAQDAFAFGVRLQRQESEVDLFGSKGRPHRKAGQELSDQQAVVIEKPH